VRLLALIVLTVGCGRISFDPLDAIEIECTTVPIALVPGGEQP